jgi:hypothetical protein
MKKRNPPNSPRRLAGPKPHADLLAERLAREHHTVHAERRRGGKAGLEVDESKRRRVSIEMPCLIHP